jgi:hypothetical protein
MKTHADAKPRQTSQPPAVVTRDEDSTGGDDADDNDLPNLRNDIVDEAAQKRDHEERFSGEQKREDDKKREADDRRNKGKR